MSYDEVKDENDDLRIIYFNCVKNHRRKYHAQV